MTFFPSWCNAAARAFLVISLCALGGCFIRVTPGPDGRVESNLGADCSGSCIYHLAEEESFRRTFTAQANAGAEFIRWQDSLGPGFAGCPNPTNPVCRLEVTAIENPLEYLGLQLDAQFELLDGWNITRVEYQSEYFGPGVLRQVSATRWVEETYEGKTYDYLLDSRRNYAITLTDLAGTQQFLIDLNAGVVSSTRGSYTSAGQLSIAQSSSRVNGWFANRITFGNAWGVRVAELVEIDDNTWEQRDPRGKKAPITLAVVALRDDGLRLLDPELGRELEVSIETGEIRTIDGDGSSTLTGYVHEVGVPLDGWNMQRIYLADAESGEPDGYFDWTTETTWSLYNINGVLRGEYQQAERSARKLELRHQATNRVVRIDLDLGTVQSRVATNPLFQTDWTITNLE